MKTSRVLLLCVLAGLTVGMAAKPVVSARVAANAPSDATYLTLSAHAGLTAERVISATGSPLYFGSEMVFTHARPLSFPNEEGTPGAGTVNMVRLGGLTEDDLFLAAEDGQPGHDEYTQGRKLITYARKATASLPLSGTSNVLAGWFHDGTSVLQRAIELENKVRADGVAEFWLEELRSGEIGHPFIRLYRENADDGIITTHTQAGNVLNLSAWDTDDLTDRSFLKTTAGPTPKLTIQAPIGGALAIIPPTANPGITGALWNDSGVLKVVP